MKFSSKTLWKAMFLSSLSLPVFAGVLDPGIDYCNSIGGCGKSTPSGDYCSNGGTCRTGDYCSDSTKTCQGTSDKTLTQTECNTQYKDYITRNSCTVSDIALSSLDSWCTSSGYTKGTGGGSCDGYITQSACNSQYNGYQYVTSGAAGTITVGGIGYTPTKTSNDSTCKTQGDIDTAVTAARKTVIADCKADPNKGGCADFDIALKGVKETVRGTTFETCTTPATSMAVGCDKFNAQLNAAKSALSSYIVFPPIDGLSALYLGTTEYKSQADLGNATIEKANEFLSTNSRMPFKWIKGAHLQDKIGTDGKSVQEVMPDSKCGIVIGLKADGSPLNADEKNIVCKSDLNLGACADSDLICKTPAPVTPKTLLIAFDSTLGNVEVKDSATLTAISSASLGNVKTQLYQSTANTITLTATAIAGKGKFISLDCATGGKSTALTASVDMSKTTNNCAVTFEAQ